MRLAAIFLGLLMATGSAWSSDVVDDDKIWTLYSTNFPYDAGRHPIATFDVTANSDLTQTICQEAAELYQADFLRRKKVNSGIAIWATAKSRHWCEKGRFKK